MRYGVAIWTRQLGWDGWCAVLLAPAVAQWDASELLRIRLRMTEQL